MVLSPSLFICCKSTLVMKAYRFRIYPSRLQKKALIQHLSSAKNLWNSLLAKTKEKYEKEGKFYSKRELQLMVKGTGLYAQSAQAVAHRLDSAIKRKVSAKKQGIKFGFPRFKSLDRMKSIYYPQSGFSLAKKLKVTPFGEMAIKQHRAIGGKIKTLTLKRESSEKWFAIFCVEDKTPMPNENRGPRIGIDLGLEKFATLSDGTIIQNPHHLNRLQAKLVFVQRILSYRKKGSRNRQKAKLKIARVHERISNARHDFLHKTANRLLSSYSFIALEDLNIHQLAQKGHGKGILDASWKKFADILCYKAESAGSEVVFVNPENTSKQCSACGTIVEKTLWQRQHTCPNCKLSIGRDLNASINILARATVGITGSNACGDETAVLSLKQEVHTLRSG